MLKPHHEAWSYTINERSGRVYQLSKGPEARSHGGRTEATAAQRMARGGAERESRKPVGQAQVGLADCVTVAYTTTC